MDGLRRPTPPKPSPMPAPRYQAPPAVPPRPVPPLPEPARRRSVWPSTLLALFCLFIALGSFLAFQAFTAAKHIQFTQPDKRGFLSQLGSLAHELGSEDYDALKKTADGRINILLLGRAGEKYPGRNLTDTIMLMSVDVAERRVALLSIPRDLFVALPEAGISGKINSFYQYGLTSGAGTQPIRQAVETVTGQPIHYSLVLDFDGFEQVIDALGGVRVDVVKDFYDPRYPGKNYSYETFELKKGWQTLDGATALKYVRERHDDPEGDFGRAKRQQQVIAAVREQAFSTETFLRFDRAHRLFQALGKSIVTDATLPEMENFFSLAQKIDSRRVETYVVDAWKPESLLRVSHVELGGVRAFTLVPRTGNWHEIREKSADIFDQEALAQRKLQVAAEEARVTLLARSEDESAARELARRLRESLGREAGVEIVSQPYALARWPETSIIVDRTDLAKPWTLDTLLKQFDLEKAEGHVVLRAAQTADTSDLVFIFGTSLARSLPAENLRESASFPEEELAEPLIIKH